MKPKLNWQSADAVKPNDGDTVIAVDYEGDLWVVLWDEDFNDWMDAQGQAEIPSLQWWAEINWP